MASKRKTKKARWMSVKAMLKQLDSYRVKYSYRFYGGYFIYQFNRTDYNLHITFKDLPDVIFGIWDVGGYGDDRLYFFAEHKGYLDKFKPTAVSFTWSSLEDMMGFVKRCMADKGFYKQAMCDGYSVDGDWDKEAADLLKYNNGFYGDERNQFIKKFGEFISSIDTTKIDIFWTKSLCFHAIYDVYYYVEKGVTDEELDELDKKIKECCCHPPHIYGLPEMWYWKHRKRFQMKVAPENKRLYTNYKVWKRYFRRQKYGRRENR